MGPNGRDLADVHAVGFETWIRGACDCSVSVRARLGATGLTGNRIAFLARRVS